MNEDEVLTQACLLKSFINCWDCMNSWLKVIIFSTPQSSFAWQIPFWKWTARRSSWCSFVLLLSICRELVWTGPCSTLSCFWRQFFYRRNRISCNISLIFHQAQFYLLRNFLTIPLDFHLVQFLDKMKLFLWIELGFRWSLLVALLTAWLNR